MAERSKAPVLKTGEVHASVGSNPTPSAISWFPFPLPLPFPFPFPTRSCALEPPPPFHNQGTKNTKEILSFHIAI